MEGTNMFDMINAPNLKVLSPHVIEFDGLEEFLNTIMNNYLTQLKVEEAELYKEYNKKNGTDYLDISEVSGEASVQEKTMYRYVKKVSD